MRKRWRGAISAWRFLTGDSLGQVASQTLRNLVAVDAASRMVVFRPLIGTDKIDILATARKIGTYDISSEPFSRLLSVFSAAHPALYVFGGSLEEAESKLDVGALVAQGLRGATLDQFDYKGGEIKAEVEAPMRRAMAQQRKAIA